MERKIRRKNRHGTMKGTPSKVKEAYEYPKLGEDREERGGCAVRENLVNGRRVQTDRHGCLLRKVVDKEILSPFGTTRKEKKVRLIASEENGKKDSGQETLTSRL